MALLLSLKSQFIKAYTVSELISAVNSNPSQRTMPIFIDSAAVKELTNSTYGSSGKGFACKTAEDMIDIFLSVGSGDVVISGRLTPSTRVFTYDSYARKGDFSLAPVESAINIKGLDVGSYAETEIRPSVSGEHIVLFRICPCGSKNGWFEVRVFDKTNMDSPIHLGSRNSGAISISEAWDSQYTYFCYAHLSRDKTYVARFTNRTSNKTDATYSATFSINIIPIRQ